MAATTSPSTRVPSGGAPAEGRTPGPERHTAAPGRVNKPSPFSRVFGIQPIGMLLTAPYAIFIAVVFAFPMVFAIWMSFHDYFFTAPGVSVPHPFVGLTNYKNVLTDPDVLASFAHVGEFLIINVPLTVALSLLLATALNRAIRGRTFFRVAYYVPYVAAERRGRSASGCSCSTPTAWSTRSSGRWRRTRRGWSIPRGRCRRSRST